MTCGNFNITDWPKDKNGIIMLPGKRVKTPSGDQSTLVFINGALRFLTKDIDNLRLNNSLVYCERWNSEDFEVI